MYLVTVINGWGRRGAHLYRTGGNRESRGSHALNRSHRPHLSVHKTKQQTNYWDSSARHTAVVLVLVLVRACRYRVTHS